MKISLTANEVRVLAALIEKEATTPENYPLSLNALTNACNQKTNREPVLNLSETEVLDAVDGLVQKTLVARRGSASSRVDKFGHRLNSRLGDEYSFSQPELAALSVLMLRGPQTAGEIRARCTRLYTFADAAELEQTLNALAEREDGPFVTRLARLPGHKESRFAQLWAGEPESGEISVSRPASDSGVAELERRLAELERRVAELERKP